MQCAGLKEQSLPVDKRLQLVVKFDRFSHTLFSDSEGWLVLVLVLAGLLATEAVNVLACTSSTCHSGYVIDFRMSMAA